MPTSGTITYTLTARDVISYALRKIGVIKADEDPSPIKLSRSLIEMNLMLKSWQKYEQIWRITEGYVNLLANVSAYSLTPIPYRIIDVRYRSAAAQDLPLTEMTRQEYHELPDRTSVGMPTMWYFDRQRSTTSLFVWPVLDVPTTDTFRVTYQRRYEDVTNLQQEIDIPQDYLALVGYNLAARLADDFGLMGENISRVVSRAESILTEALDDDREDFLQVMPDMMQRKVN